MNKRILTMALSPEAGAELAAIIPDAVLQRMKDATEVQFAIGQGGQGIAVLVVGADVPADECASMFTWVSLYAPHVQCVMVARDDQLPKIIEVKNQVTSMSVAQYPWQENTLRKLVENLVVRSEQKAVEDRFMRKSLAPFAVNIGQARIITLYQLLGQKSDGEGSERVLSFLEVAVAFRDQLASGPLQTKELLLHASDEAIRMVEIMEHVKRWHEAFDDGSPVRSLPSVFSVLNGVLMIRDIEDQFAPANGPIGAIPTSEQCCLLALLSWSKSSAILKQRHDGLWVVEEANGLNSRQSSLGELLA